MAAGFLVLLLVAWIAIFFPSASRARARSPLISSRMFKRSLALIGPHSPEHLGVRPVDGAAHRPLTIHTGRLLTLLGLLAGSILTGAMALAGTGAVEVHLASDAVVTFYVAWLIEDRRRRDERSRKIASLAAYRASLLADMDDHEAVREAL